MRSNRLARWMLPALFRRYALSLSLAAIGIGLFAVLVPVVSDTADSANSAIDGLGSPALRALNVAGYSGPDATQEVRELNKSTLAGIERMPHVERVAGWADALVSIETRSDGFLPYSFIPRIEGVQPPLVAGKEPDGDFRVLIPSSLATTYGFVEGDALPMEHNRFVSEGVLEGTSTRATISGIYDDSVAGMDGGQVIYGTLPSALALLAIERGRDAEWMENNFTFPTAYVFADDVQEVSKLATELRDEGFGAESLTSLLTQVPSLQKFLDATRPVLASGLALFLVVIAWSTSSSVLASKRSEVGILRALGWSRREVVATFGLQFAAQGLVVGIGGAGIGLGVLLALRGWMSTTEFFGLPLVIDLQPETFVQLTLLALAPVPLFLLTSAVPVARLANVAPDDVLRELRSS